MMVETVAQHTAAKAWAEDTLKLLTQMSLDERHHWNATKPGGQRFFNSRRISYVVRIFPEYRQRFLDMGLLVR